MCVKRYISPDDQTIYSEPQWEGFIPAEMTELLFVFSEKCHLVLMAQQETAFF